MPVFLIFFMARRRKILFLGLYEIRIISTKQRLIGLSRQSAICHIYLVRHQPESPGIRYQMAQHHQYAASALPIQMEYHKTIHLSFQKPHRLSRKDFRILIKLLSGVKCHDWDILVYLFRDILHGFLSFTEAQADTALAPYELADCLAQQIAVPSLRKEYGAAEIGDCCVAIVFLQVPDILLWCC